MPLLLIFSPKLFNHIFFRLYLYSLLHPSLPDATPVSVHFKYSTLYSLGFLYSVSITRSCLPEQSFSCKRNSYTRGFNSVFPVALNKVLFPKLKKKSHEH